MMMNKTQKQNGFTLIELMIAMLIGLIVVGATITIYIITIKGSSDTLKSARLNQDLSVAMLVMTNDVRRAGYWGGAITGANLTTNPFTDMMVRDVGATAGAASGNCITYSYDENAWEVTVPPYDPVVDSVAPSVSEYFGFRLVNGAIQIKSSGTTSLAPACGDGVWVNLTDSDQFTVTRLLFELTADNTATNSSGNTVTARQIEISIDGEVESDDEISASLNEFVKIRNNLIEP
jgi:prepilin peptidase dependent protein B